MFHRPTLGRRRASYAVSLALLALALIPAVRAQSHTTWYQGPLRADPKLHAMEVTPLWRDRLDSPTALVTDDAVVYLREGRLIATELTSGWQQWSYGSGLQGPLLLAGGQVLLAEGGRVTALNAADGQPLWSTQVTEPPIRYLLASGDSVLVGAGGGGHAALLDLTSGRLQHQLELPGPAEPLHVGASVIVFSATYGEPNANWFHAYDPGSGEELWRGQRWHQLLAVEDGSAYLLNHAPPGATALGARFSVSVVNALTGARQGHWQYDFAGQVQAWSPTAGTVMVLAQDALFAQDAASGRVFRFERGGAAAPEASYAAPGRGTFRAGPHLGLLFFETSDHRLVATTVAGGTSIAYLFGGAQISRLDIVGARAFVGRTDGTLLAVDLQNARIRYLLSAGGMGFGRTVDAGEYVIVQGSAELLVLEDVP